MYGNAVAHRTVFLARNWAAPSTRVVDVDKLTVILEKALDETGQNNWTHKLDESSYVQTREFFQKDRFRNFCIKLTLLKSEMCFFFKRQCFRMSDEKAAIRAVPCLISVHFYARSIEKRLIFSSSRTVKHVKIAAYSYIQTFFITINI